MVQMELPPGFRFHPTDEELITHYLSKKVLDGNFIAVAIGEVDLNECEPWDLPWRAKMGEEEWYFFCVRDRKYPAGLRTNRATESGYWKSTGKDKEIYRGKRLVGMKKTLVFYRGRAPRGEKTEWVMHEYRLEGKANYSVYNLPKTAKNEWVICRVFNKSSAGGKKKGCSIAMGRLLLQQVRMEAGSSSSAASYGLSVELYNNGKPNSSLLPPLMDVNTIKEKINTASEPMAAAAHVTCFSNAALEDQKGNNMEEEFSTNPNLSRLPPDYYYFNTTATATAASTTSGPFAASHVSPSSFFISNMNMNMNMPAASLNNPLGLNMHHHQQQQKHYITNPTGSLMQMQMQMLLQSNVYGVVRDQQQNGTKATDKEKLSSISQETGLTTDMNPEIDISSVNNNNDNVPNANNEVPSTSAAAPQHLDDCLWGY